MHCPNYIRPPRRGTASSKGEDGVRTAPHNFASPTPTRGRVVLTGCAFLVFYQRPPIIGSVVFSTAGYQYEQSTGTTTKPPRYKVDTAVPQWNPGFLIRTGPPLTAAACTFAGFLYMPDNFQANADSDLLDPEFYTLSPFYSARITV